MKKRGSVVFFLIFLVLITGVLAFEYVEHLIEKNYQTGDIIRGEVTINLTDENIDSIFRSNFEGNIKLLELLKKSGLEEGFDFNCNTFGCGNLYSARDVTGNFALAGEKIIGLKVSGNSVELESLKFDIKSSLAASCSPPLFLDILADGKDEITGNVATGNKCFGAVYGCFDRGLASSEYSDDAIITDSMLCENITLAAGASYSVGARIKNRTRGDEGTLSMEILDFSGDSLGYCDLPMHRLSNEDLSCIIDYSSPYSKSYYVCVSNTEFVDSDYRIRSEKRGKVCGTSNEDFEIFAQAIEFGKIDMEINEELFENFDYGLVDTATEYLFENFGTSDDLGINCENDCIIPIKIRGLSQNIELSNLDLRYTNDGVSRISNNFYDVVEEKAKVSSIGTVIDLTEANFLIPIESNANEFKLYLDEKLIFTEKIKLTQGFNFDINPKFSLIGRENLYKIEGVKNISLSFWDFDGDVLEIEGNSVRYTFLEEGNYDVIVEVTRNDGLISKKTFRVVVGNPRESASAILLDYNNRLEKITNEINLMETWVGIELKEIINIVELNNTLQKLKNKFEESINDEEYTEVIYELLDLYVPVKIGASEEGNLPMAIGFNNIDLYYLEEVSKKEVLDSEVILGRIANWISEYYSPEIEFEVISAFSEFGSEDLLTRFSIKLNQKLKPQNIDYLFIGYPIEDIKFKKDYRQEDVGGSGTFIEIDESKVFDFIIFEILEVEELGSYISPEIKNLGLTNEDILFDDDEGFRTGFFLMWLGIIFISFLILYIILQEWYKKNYEGKLFNNPNDLYNLVNFIYNSRVAGLKDDQIQSKLKGTGWSGEKIRFAFRKIDGKRTGMWEIPIFKFAENRKVRKEIEKRNRGQINTKFIKRVGVY